MRFKQGKPTGSLKKTGAARGTGRRCSSAPTRRSSRRSSSTPPSFASGWRWRAICIAASRSSFDDETSGIKTPFQHDEGLVDYVKKIVGERGAKTGSRRALHRSQKENGLKAELVLQWTEVHRRAYAQLRQRHPDRIGRHARERVACRASAKPFATTSTRITSRPRA